MTTDERDETTSPASAGERIAKRLARAGLCSRRDAERWIADRRVAVNGVVLDSPACVVTANDLILVDGQPVSEPERTRLWRYHKPAGLVTTHRDPEGRKTVFETLPADLPRVVSVGRLDLNSEGLLLLTNDGALARKMELPSNGWVRRYRVRVHGEVDPVALQRLDRGVTVEGQAYGSIKATLDRQQGANAWLTVALHEGKNREIRRVMDYLGWPVTRLIRVAYGPFQLGTLEERAVDEVPGKVLREQTGGAKPVLRPKVDSRPAGEREKDERLKEQDQRKKAAPVRHGPAKGNADANRRRKP
ncbi:pseudouridine synthase [Magnetospirillum fulvum]|jgi:23S rRNA pseudouridine2605 synthase|uniref:Pseudouridine synthase n=1 Tax=Magnetospirillum fulvum TaxID=1082 RepID=A0A1H6IB40_MAGFU|nr:pseudouridine synthase [Magnetospirillum fulvum]SEH44088.1 23S rRNA pseudouridine2605 synthase [Magnetospirillum fulvum]